MQNNVQLHLGLIPDGNRRWARQWQLMPWQGHEAGTHAFKQIINWARQDPRLAVLTIWGFSTENWNRSSQEISELMRLYEQWLRDEQSMFHEKETRLVHSGRSERIPSSLARLLTNLSSDTGHYKDFTLNFALDYGDQDEIIRAIQKIINPKKISADTFRQYLDHPELPDIDIIVRTSGEQRTSGIFIWQSAYAELIFIEKFFPDLTPADLDAAVGDYTLRHRRFGA